MKMKIIYLKTIFVCFLLLSTTGSSVDISNKSTQGGREIYVDDDNTNGPWDGSMENPYQTIRKGIEVAEKGDTVFIFSGTYVEAVEFKKDINVVGMYNDPTKVVIRSDSSENSLKVFEKCNGGKIANVTLDNSLNSPGYYDVVYIENSNFLIDNCIINERNRYNQEEFEDFYSFPSAIKLINSSKSCTIRNTTITLSNQACSIGIYLNDNADKISIENCTITGVGEYSQELPSIGILLNDCKDNYVYNCTIEDCYYGLLGMRRTDVEELNSKRYNIIQKSTFNDCFTGASLTPIMIYDEYYESEDYKFEKTVTLTKFQDSIFIRNEFGIYMAGCHNQIINNCSISNSLARGIQVRSSKGIKILNSDIIDNFDGILFSAIDVKRYIPMQLISNWNPRLIGSCSAIEIKNNTLENNSDSCGIIIFGNCNNIDISKNIFRKNRLNIQLGYGSVPYFSLVHSFLNELLLIIKTDLLIGDFQSFFYKLTEKYLFYFVIQPYYYENPPIDNHIYFNDFYIDMDNTLALDYGNNNWYKKIGSINKSVGNYWDDFNEGADVDKEDGIIDYPRSIEGGMSNSDEFPLKYSIHSTEHRKPKVTLKKPNGGECFDNKTINITWDAFDHDIYPLYGTPTKDRNVTVDLYYMDAADLPNPGESDFQEEWRTIATNLNNTGYFRWDISELKDYGLYSIKIVVKDEMNHSDSDVSSKPIIVNKNDLLHISSVDIIDTTIDSSEVVKDGHDVQVIAYFHGKIGDKEVGLANAWLGPSEEEAGYTVDIDEENQYIRFLMGSVNCNPKNGRLYLPIVIHDDDNSYNANYGTIIADNKDPKADIIQPSSGVYINNVKILSVGNFPFAITIGPVRVSANIYDETGIESIDWYVNQHHIDFNGEKRFELWLDKNITGMKSGLNRIKVIVQDKAGNVAHDSITINRLGR